MALQKVVIKIEGDTKQLDPTIKKLERLGKIDKDNARQFKKSSTEFQESTKKKGSLMQGLGKQALALGVALVGAFAIKQAVFSAINIIKDFEKSMSELSAITGATGKDLKFLEEQAKRIGSTTTISAKEAVIAFKLMASAKPELLKAKEQLAEVTDEAVKLAEASGLDLPTAIEALAITLNSMDLAADEAARVVNVLSAASLRGAKEIPFLTFALSKFGGVAASAGLSIETSAAAIELLGEKIPQAETVGTNLRNIIIQLQIEAKKQGRTFKDLGTELDLLAPRLGDVSFLTKTFGKESILAIQTLIKQRDRLEDLTEAITDTNAAQEQQIVNTDNLDSSLKKLNNVWEVFILSMSGSAGILKIATDFFTDFLKGATDYINIRTQMAEADVSYFTKLKASFGIQSAFDEIMEAIKETLEETADATDELADATDDAGEVTKKQIRNVFFLTKEIAALKGELKKEGTSLNRIKEIQKELVPLEKELGVLIGKTTKKVKDKIKAVKELILIQSDGLKEELEGRERADAMDEATFKNRVLRSKFAEGIVRLAIDLRKDESELSQEFAKSDFETFKEFEEAKRAELQKTEEEIATKRLKTIELVKTATVDLANEVANIRTALLERQLQEEEEAFIIQSDALQEQFDNKLITEEQFNDGKIKLEDDFDKKMAEFQTKQAKASKAAAVFSSVINTFAAVIAALVSIPPNVPLSIIVGVTGAAQTTAIIAQPIPKFHKGKRGEYSDEEINAKVLRSEYVIPPEPSRKHREDLDAMLNNKFDHFVFMKYQMPIIKQYSKAEQAGFSDSAITRHQRKQTDLLMTNNQLLRQMIPSMKRASYGWE